MPRISEAIIVKISATKRWPFATSTTKLANLIPAPVIFRTPTTIPAVPQAQIMPHADLAPSAIASRISLRLNFRFLMMYTMIQDKMPQEAARMAL